MLLNRPSITGFTLIKEDCIMDNKIEISLVSKDQINEETDMIRITLVGSFVIGWGKTLQEAIQDFDCKLTNKMQTSFE
jgi:ADP-glucose pyrophosphorylase